MKSYQNKTLNIRSYVTYTGKVDTSKPGEYIVTYKGQYKKQAYTAVTKKLTVVVVPKTVVAPLPEEPTTPEQPTTGPEETTTGGNNGESSNETNGWTDFH